jgi:hypothetical protein
VGIGEDGREEGDGLMAVRHGGTARYRYIPKEFSLLMVQ